MKLRKTAIAGILGSISLVAAACGSTATTDEDIGLSQASLASAAATGVLVTQPGAAVTAEPSIWIGAHTVPVPEIFAQLLGLTAGERVALVTPGGPSDGLLILGDTIVAVDGGAIGPDGGLAAALATRADGETVTLSVIRGGESIDVPVTLTTRPAHELTGSLSEIDDLFGRALSGEFRFLDRDGGEHTAAFDSGTISGVNAGRVTLSRPGNGPTTLTLSPNVFVWIDGAPGSVEDLASAADASAKVVTLDDEVLAVLAGGIIPPVLETLEGFIAPEGLLGTDGSGLLEALGALEMLQGLFGAEAAPAPDAGL